MGARLDPVLSPARLWSPIVAVGLFGTHQGGVARFRSGDGQFGRPGGRMPQYRRRLRIPACGSKRGPGRLQGVPLPTSWAPCPMSGSINQLHGDGKVPRICGAEKRNGDAREEEEAPPFDFVGSQGRRMRRRDVHLLRRPGREGEARPPRFSPGREEERPVRSVNSVSVRRATPGRRIAPPLLDFGTLPGRRRGRGAVRSRQGRRRGATSDPCILRSNRRTW